MRHVDMSKASRTSVYSVSKRKLVDEFAVYVNEKYEGRVDQFRDIAFVEYVTDFIGPLQRYQRRKQAEFALRFKCKAKKYHLRVNKNQNVFFSDIEGVEEEVKRTFPNARKYEIKG